MSGGPRLLTIFMSSVGATRRTVLPPSAVPAASVVLDKQRVSTRLALVLLASVRLLMGWCICTSYVPDEYYQYTDAAYRWSMHIDAGSPMDFTNLTWEWQSNARIRSFVTLLPLVSIYRLLPLMGSAWQSLLVPHVPRLLQALAAILADFAFASVARSCGNESFVHIALGIHSISWFYGYCMCRTLSNSWETVLLLLTTHCVLQKRKTLNLFSTIRISYLSIATALACVSLFVRATSAIFLVPLFFGLLSRDGFAAKHMFSLLAVAVFTTQCCILIDTLAYGTVTVVPLQFFLHNILLGRASHFGVSPWHFYFTNGLPTVFGLLFPYLLLGLCSTDCPWLLRQLSRLSLWNVIVLAIVSRHAEHRFLLSSLPFFHLLIAWACYQYWAQAHTFRNRQFLSGLKDVFFRKSILIIISVLHVGLVAYLSIYHQSGPETAYRYLERRLVHEDRREGSGVAHVYVASSCYSFPGAALLDSRDHRVQVFHAPCLPPWEGVDNFAISPERGVQQLNSMIHCNSDGDSFLMTFDSYEPYVVTGIDAKLIKLASFHHAHFRYDFDDLFPKESVVLFQIYC